MTANEQAPLQHEIILYATPDGNVRVEVLFASESFWLTQKKMAELFGVESHTITYHLQEIYKPGELKDLATTRKIRVVQTEGARTVSRDVTKELAEEQYAAFDLAQDRSFESDFERATKKILEAPRSSPKQKKILRTDSA
jgi:hypothetical protein